MTARSFTQIKTNAPDTPARRRAHQARRMELANHWSARVRAEAGPGKQLDELLESKADDLVDLLANAAVSVGHGWLGLQFSVVAGDAGGAGAVAVIVAQRALKKVGLSKAVLREVTVTAEDLAEAELDDPTIPTLVGVHEIAELLGVTKQRASSLAREGRFPTPVATLASGPVWAESTIVRFVENWSRRPGRPSRIAADDPS